MFRCSPAIALVCITGLFLAAAGCSMQISDGAKPGAESSLFTPGLAYPAYVFHVIDGDTLKVTFADGGQETIRILGVDTPELSSSDNDPGSFEGISDTQLLASWGEEASFTLHREIEGREILLTTDRAAGERDRYGRLLAYISTSDGTDIGERLVSRGLARVYTPESFARKEEYLGVQQTAVLERIGIWSGTPPAAPGSDGIFLASVHYDAAGDDRTNLNDEYVTIRNNGSTEVDINGWQIRDNDTIVFVFPEMILPPGDQIIVHTGNGYPGRTELFIGSGFPILNNDAGTVTLHDRAGAELSRFSWD